MPQLDEVLHTHVVEMRGDDVVDLVRVELAVGIHLSGVLIERRVMQLLAAQALASGVCVRSANISGVDSTSMA